MFSLYNMQQIQKIKEYKHLKPKSLKLGEIIFKSLSA